MVNQGKLIITDTFVPQYNISFFDEKKQIGKLSWDDGIMEFEGDKKESAECFFKFLKPYIDDYIKKELEAHK